jgi:hypothetical protein
MTTRRQYIERLAAKLHEWDERIDELRSRAELSDMAARAAARRKLTELREKRDRAVDLLDELHEAGDKGWMGVKSRVDDLYDEVKQVFRKAA